MHQLVLLYSLNITPPLITHPPYYLHKFAAEVYQFTPPSVLHGKFNKNGRTLRLRRTRGRLELTVPPYIESSYLRGSRLVASRWWCKNCIAFSDCTHSASSLIHDPLPCRIQQLQASSHAVRDSDRQFSHCCFPFVLHSKEGGI